jgi:hypothetical protein
MTNGHEGQGGPDEMPIPPMHELRGASEPLTRDEIMRLLAPLEERTTTAAWTEHEASKGDNPKDYTNQSNAGYDQEGYPYQQ